MAYSNPRNRILRLALTLTTAACCAAGAVAAETPAPPAGGAPEVRVEPPENYCVGGIDDGKIIVDESQMESPFRETTRLGCEVDGGDPHTMPDLPRPTAERTRLV